jgi:hypothetical protein
MKNITFLFAISILFGSCMSSNNVVSNSVLNKRKYTTGWHFDNIKNFKTPSISDGTYVLNEDAACRQTNITPILSSSYKEDNISVVDYSLININSDAASDILLRRQNIESSYVRQDEDCAEIIKRNGDIIEAVIIEVGVNEIKYKKCRNPDGPTYSILRSDVFMIKNKNGDNDVFNDKKSSPDSDELKVEPFSIVSLITGISGLVFGLLLFVFGYLGLGIFLGILGIIFGAISLKRVKANPDKYTKSSYKIAKAGLITGIVITALSLILFVL